jgi:hypothetical protein
MRTTIEIPDALFDRVRRQAEARATSVDKVVTDALESQIADSAGPGATYRFEPIIVSGGLQPGLSWDDWETIRRMSYEREVGE